MLQALQNPAFSGDRFYEVQDWLRSYQVFQGLTRNQRQAITNNLISFYDFKRRTRIRSINHMLTEFRHLEETLRRNADLVTKGGQSRRIESLTSKALWCCYPLDVPIMDAFAEAALRVIARLIGVTITHKPTRYDQFAELWFKIYELVQPKVIDFAMHNPAYPVRVFDRYLWWLGQNSYEGLIEN